MQVLFPALSIFCSLSSSGVSSQKSKKFSKVKRKKFPSDVTVISPEYN